MLARELGNPSPRAVLGAMSFRELLQWQEHFHHAMTSHDLLVYGLAVQGALPNCYASMVAADDIDPDVLEEMMSACATVTWRPDEC